MERRIKIIKNQIFPEAQKLINRYIKTKDINQWIRNKLNYIKSENNLPIFLKQFLITYYQKKNFNMIEILIAISIIVTFSSLTGALFARKWEESKENYAKLDLIKIQEGLVMYFTKNSTYPLDLDQLVCFYIV